MLLTIAAVPLDEIMQSTKDLQLAKQKHQLQASGHRREKVVHDQPDREVTRWESTIIHINYILVFRGGLVHVLATCTLRRK
jgi:hypothetical protein